MFKRVVTSVLFVGILAGLAACAAAPAAPAPAAVATTVPAQPTTAAPAAQVQPTAAAPAAQAQPTVAATKPATAATPASGGTTVAATKLVSPSISTKDGKRVVTDSTGRQVTVPAVINKVYATSPVGTIFMYTLVPEKLAGLASAPSEWEKKYTLDSYLKLPVLGGTFGASSTMNPEVVAKAKPDVIVSMGDMNPSDKENADKIQAQLNIPVLMISMSIDNMDKAYALMGELLGVPDRAKELGDYVRKTVDDIKTIAQTIPADKRVRVYYAEGPAGLQTDPTGSRHSELLELIGATNVAKVDLTPGNGRTAASLEQVLMWNPEVILVGMDSGFAAGSSYELITTDAKWKGVKAVADKKVYAIPFQPFCWFDRPPSVNRVVGVRWVANLIYPRVYKYDIRADAKEIYSKFYQRTLTDAELDDILRSAK